MAKKSHSRLDVSFLILNYNGKDLTKILLDSIKKQDFKGKYEIIVVDNNSSGDDVRFFRKNYPKVMVVENKKNLGTPGVNSAISKLKGRYVFFLNNDIELKKDTLRKIFDYIESHPSVGVVAPRPINYFNKKIKSGGLWISRSFYAGHYIDDNAKSPKDVPYAGIFMFRREIISKRGYIFDPDYFIYSEDLDFCLCSWMMGYKVVFLPYASFYHMHAATIKKQSYNLTFIIERNLLSTYLKNLPMSLIFLYLPYILLMRIVGIFKDMIKFEFRNIGARISAISYVIAHIPNILEKRKKLQRYRKISSRIFRKLFSEKYLMKGVVPV